MPDAPSPPAAPRSPPVRWGLAGAILLAGVIAGWFAWPRETTPAAFERGWRAIEAGDIPTAFQIARALPQSPDAQPYRQLLTAAILAQRGQPDQALPDLAEPSRFEPTAVRAYTLAAECHYRQGRWGEAIVAAQAALQRDPEALAARRWLAAAAYDIGTVGMAAEELKKVAAADPTDGRPHRLLGLIEKDRSEYPQAIEFYRESLRRQPDPPDRQEIREELAEACLKVNDYEQGLAALADCADTPTTLVLRARCLGGLGRDDDQDAALAAARALAPDDLTVLSDSAARALLQGDVAQAITWLERAVARHPSDSAAHYQLSQAYERGGRQADAERERTLFQQWQKLEFEFTELHNAASGDVQNAGLRVQLGDLALKLGKPELAGTWYRAALALNPTLDKARRALERLEPGPK